MRHLNILLVGSGVIAIAGCSTERPIQIRATADAARAAPRPLSQRIGEGRAELALGNSALALESFRRASREQPDSVEALQGVGAAYEAMGRSDLADRSYQAALALAPHDSLALNRLASIERETKNETAAVARPEIAETPPAVAVDARDITDQPIAAQSSDATSTRPTSAIISRPIPPIVTAVRAVPVVEPGHPPAPVVTARVASAMQTPIRSASPTAIVAATTAPVARRAMPLPPAPVFALAAPIELVAPLPPMTALPPRAPQPAQPPQPAPPPHHVRLTSSVTLILPPPRPARVAMAQNDHPRPHLERLSLGEVALVTAIAPTWRRQSLTASAGGTNIRYIPLATASLRTASVRLLNAPRRQGLAADTRTYLHGLGWRQLAIGDAIKPRQSSLILYPANQRALALRLSRQFGFAARPSHSSREIVLLLGRDSWRAGRRRLNG